MDSRVTRQPYLPTAEEEELLVMRRLALTWFVSPAISEKNKIKIAIANVSFANIPVRIGYPARQLLLTFNSESQTSGSLGLHLRGCVFMNDSFFGSLGACFVLLG